jgi:hypothetical protein
MRRSVAIIVVLFLFTIAIIAVVVLRSQDSKAVPGTVAIPDNCNIVGTSGRDIRTGNNGGQTICLLPGNDYAHGKGGDDTIKAGSGDDTSIGGKGLDKVQGGGGNDQLFSVDERGGDKVVGGAGTDRCYVDPGDQTFGCNKVYLGFTSQMARALEANLFSVMSIAEDAIEDLPIPPLPGQTITKTVTIAPGFCNEEPPDPPAFC